MVKSTTQRKVDRILEFQEQGLYESATHIFRKVRCINCKALILGRLINQGLFTSFELKDMVYEAYRNSKS